ncbi:MAG: hypothetical protein ACFFG0_38850 [Candidatus Thorarchaeota archaeon]
MQAIPKDVLENIAFRKELHGYLCTDDKAKAVFMALCFLEPRAFFNSTLWTFNSQLKHKNIPFILWPHQEPAIVRMKQALEGKTDLFFDKSRKQGATYIILAIYLLYFLTVPDEKFLLGSRKEDLVDNNSQIINNHVVGSEETLFFKLLYMLNTLPLYLKPQVLKKDMFLQNLETYAAFRGDATNLGFGQSFRGRGNLIDEAAKVEPKMIQQIIENLADTSTTSIFNSTNGPWGSAHPYSKLMKQHPQNVIKLSFFDNPTQNYGRYTSPKEGEIIIKDIEYYRKAYPGQFDLIEENKPIPVEEVSDIYPFVADGGVSTFGMDRTAWFDVDEKRPGRTRRGIAQNLFCIDSGSTELFFDFNLLNNLKDGVCDPDDFGDINYELDSNNYIQDVWFEPGGKQSIFCWWGELPNRRPNQNHNYVVGCDLSKGTGTSNSVAAVEDVNTNEIVGLLVTPYKTIPDFAEQVVALCEWVGGNIQPLLIWEENGASDFLRRVDELGYYNLYVKIDKEGNKLKSKTKHGWRSMGGPEGTKKAILDQLENSLQEGLREYIRFSFLKLYDSQTINEMEAYVYFEGKFNVGPVAMQTESSGAKASHGDRVIAVALCNEGKKQIEPGICVTTQMIHPDSWLARKQNKETAIAKQKENSKIWWN